MQINKTFIYVFLGLGIVVGLVSTLLLLRSSQDTRSSADTPSTDVGFTLPTPPTDVGFDAGINDDACPALSAPQNVRAEYPGCDEEENCTYVQASCEWDSVADASSYSLKIYNTDTQEEVRNDTVDSETTRILFDVTQGSKYTCEVSVVNSCGSVSDAGVGEVICEVEEVPTVPPTQPPVTIEPTPTTIVTAPPVVTPTPTLPPTGPVETLIVGGIVGALLIIVGGLLFVL